MTRGQKGDLDGGGGRGRLAGGGQPQYKQEQEQEQEPSPRGRNEHKHTPLAKQEPPLTGGGERLTGRWGRDRDMGYEGGGDVSPWGGTGEREGRRAGECHTNTFSCLWLDNGRRMWYNLLNTSGVGRMAGVYRSCRCGGWMAGVIDRYRTPRNDTGDDKSRKPCGGLRLVWGLLCLTDRAWCSGCAGRGEPSRCSGCRGTHRRAP